jgi:hypothetical protein
MTPTSPTLDGSLKAVTLDLDPVAIKPIAMTEFGIAQTHRQVLECWKLVYRCYTESGLIDANSFELHTSRQAASPTSAVIYGQTQGQIDSTLTVIADGPQGLPLDQVYKPTLDHLRSQGHKLVEVGLLADARTDHSRFSMEQTFGTMRYGLYRAYYAQADIVIGVHPRHAAFYTRMLGLEVIGPLSQHPTVKNRPVLLMRLDINRIRLEPTPRLLRYIKANPVEQAEFDRRYPFSNSGLSRSIISQYLNHMDFQQKFNRFQTPAAIKPIQQIR